MKAHSNRGGQIGRFNSRGKGARVERIVIDWVRQLGYTAYRIPFSGAAPGEKGDVKIEIPNTRIGDRPMDAKFIYGEVKARHTSFNTIYTLYNKLRRGNPTLCVDAGETLFMVTTDFNSLGIITPPGAYIFDKYVVSTPENNILKRIVKMKELLKGCEFLVLKGNNRPLLFVRYF